MYALVYLERCSILISLKGIHAHVVHHSFYRNPFNTFIGTYSQSASDDLMTNSGIDSMGVKQFRMIENMTHKCIIEEKKHTWKVAWKYPVGSTMCNQIYGPFYEAS